MVPCLVFSVALAALMRGAVAFFAGVFRFTAFSTSCFVFAVFCTVSVFVAGVALCELQLGCISFRSVSTVVGVKSMGDPVVRCFRVVCVDDDRG